MIDNELFKWALTQGGLVIVIIVVLWAYRKDLIRIQQKDEEKTTILIELVKNVTVALYELKAVIKQ